MPLVCESCQQLLCKCHDRPSTHTSPIVNSLPCSSCGGKGRFWEPGFPANPLRPNARPGWIKCIACGGQG